VIKYEQAATVLPRKNDDEAPRSEPRRRNVLVALQGKRAPASAIAMARIVSAALRRPLHGVFVWPTPIPASEVPRLLRASASALEGIVLDVEVGEPVDQIAALAERSGAGFVVLGLEPEGREASPLGIGETAARLLSVLRVPVLLVPSGAGAKLERILLPLDGTPSTASALEPAGELAREIRASLDIVLVGEAQHAREPEPGAMAPPQYVDQPQHEWPAFSDEFLHRFLCAIGHCPPGVPTRFFLGVGDPAEEILRYADELHADLAVLVWHGDLEDRHGTVFRRVLSRATCPLLVLRR
jgi:nucleotide-binding universal stress UspA family protein